MIKYFPCNMNVVEATKKKYEGEKRVKASSYKFNVMCFTCFFIFLSTLHIPIYLVHYMYNTTK